MLVMTAKVHKKKLAIILAAIVVAVAGLVILLGGEKDAAPTSTTAAVASNDDRVKFLNSFGWEVTTSPTHSSQVRIPSEPSEVFTRYNDLQKDQGYDLSAYAGQTVMRYVYEVNNYPGATEPAKTAERSSCLGLFIPRASPPFHSPLCSVQVDFSTPICANPAKPCQGVPQKEFYSPAASCIALQ